MNTPTTSTVRQRNSGSGENPKMARGAAYKMNDEEEAQAEAVRLPALGP